MPDMINPQKGIDLMNNNSIINQNTLCSYNISTLPLNKKGILQTQLNTTSSGERERAATSTAFGTLTGISINHRKFFSSSSFTAWS
jgi:hypothetical protein